MAPQAKILAIFDVDATPSGRRIWSTPPYRGGEFGLPPPLSGWRISSTPPLSGWRISSTPPPIGVENFVYPPPPGVENSVYPPPIGVENLVAPPPDLCTPPLHLFTERSLNCVKNVQNMPKNCKISVKFSKNGRGVKIWAKW